MIVDLLRIILFLVIFSISAWTDLIERKSYSFIWYPGVVIGTILLVYQGIDEVSFFVGFCTLLLVLLALNISDSGIGDTKAFITLFILFPIHPDLNILPLFQPQQQLLELGLRPFFLISLENISTLCIIYPIKNILVNISNSYYEFPKSVTMTKTKAAKVEDKHGWVILNDEMIRIEELIQLAEEKDTNVRNILKFCDKEEVWVRTGIPTITVMFVGVLITLVLGISLYDGVYYLI